MLRLTGVADWSGRDSERSDPGSAPGPQSLHSVTELHFVVSYQQLDSTGSASLPDGATVFYVTSRANLDAPESDYSGPRGVLALWRKGLGKQLSVGVTGRDRNNEVTSGLAHFEVDSANAHSATLSGTLDVAVADLAPATYAVMLFRKGKPLGNPLWVDIPTWAR
jgi:hypothetical protein